MNTGTPPLRVLVVDDSEDTAETPGILATLWRHEVRVARDGQDALRQAQHFRPHVVLLDIGMPGMSGYMVAQSLRRVPGLENVLLIATTGYGSSADRQQTAGFDRHLVKPYSPDDLQRILAETESDGQPNRVMAAFLAKGCCEEKGAGPVTLIGGRPVGG